jgi:pimeloyl-ACP methyl ester carboxylesterase
MSSIRILTLTVALTAAVATRTAHAQAATANTLRTTSEARASARAFLERELRYLSLDAKVSAPEMERLVELHLQALDRTDRQAATANQTALWSKIIALYGDAAPPPRVYGPALEAMATRVANAAPTPGDPWPEGNTPLGRPGKVVRKGRGAIPMILIPPFGFDEIVYASFMERNADRYTMYAVTPAGFGGTAPPPRPDRLDLANPVWLNGFEQGVMDLIKREKLARPVVVGMSSGAYWAADLALKHPDGFRAAVLLNGMLVTPMSSPRNLGQPASREEREALAKTRFNFGLTLRLSGGFGNRNPAAVQTNLANMNQQMLTNVVLTNTRDEPRARELFAHQRLMAHPEATYGYTLELLGTDLQETIQALTVPTLVAASMADDLWPAASLSRVNIVQFEELKARHPKLPLTIVPFFDTRMFATEDSPEALDRAVGDFLAGRPVRGRERTIYLPQPSPRAYVQLALDTGFVKVQFSRVGAKGRKIFGGLVPFDSLWRAGANESTTISVPVDVIVGGKPLARGTYSVFAIPREREWTLVFNRIEHQIGTFTYNQEFDALRIDIAPRQAPMTEWLAYRLEPASDNAVDLVLAWAELEVPIRIEVRR